MTAIAPRLVAAVADRYRIERELGQGGMATVYLAWDLRHDRKVALKVLRPELAATIGPERFLREIRIAAQLQHPHILPMLESGEADGFLFYVMPFVDGESLRERVARQRELPVAEAVRLLAETVDALSYAHASGVVHRDIKPDNVMVSGRHALVMDFGVAKAVSEASGRNTLTTAGVALGTPAYMAPEQAAADPHVDHRADIYAVGVMAYELLAGRTPFTGGTPQQVLAAHITQAPDPVTRHRPGLPPALEQAIMRCLAKRPADRWQTADELLAQLEPLVATSGGITPTATRPITGWAPKPSRRVGLAVAALALGAVAAGVWVLRPAPRSAALVQLDRTQLTFTGNTRAPSLSPDGKRISYATRRCDSAGTCLFDIVVEDIDGAGSARIVEGAINVWDTEWTGDGRYLLMGASFEDGWGWYSVATLGGQRRHLGIGSGASPIGDGDTTLIVVPPTRAGDSVAWVRRVATASGTVYDSVGVASPRNEAVNLDVTSDGRLMALHMLDGRGSALIIADRSGVALDSIRFTDEDVLGAKFVPAGDAVVAFVRAESGERIVDAVAYPLGRDGRLGARETVALQLDVEFASFGRTGDLVVASGPIEYSVSAFEWGGRAGDRLRVRRLAAGNTLRVTGSISDDGREIFLVRDLPSSRGGRQGSFMPFDSGPERPLGAPMELLDWDWGTGEVFVAVRRGDSVVVGTLDPQSRRRRDLGIFPGRDFGTVEALGGGGCVVRLLSGRLARLAVPGLPDTSFTIPAEVGFTSFLSPSPDGRELAIVGWLPGADTLAMHAVSMRDGSTRRVAVFFGEGIDAPRWLADGTLLVPISETGWTEALYRVPAAGGVPVRLSLLPGGVASYRFAADGRRGIMRASDRRADVHLIRNFGELVSPQR